MPSEKVNFNALVQEVLDVISRHDLTPSTLGLIFNVPRDEFESLAQQYPGHHPGIIIIKQKNDWFVQIQPVPKPGDYPTGEILKPSPKRRK
jgi:hypothetical protein